MDRKPHIFRHCLHQLLHRTCSITENSRTRNVSSRNDLPYVVLKMITESCGENVLHTERITELIPVVTLGTRARSEGVASARKKIRREWYNMGAWAGFTGL